MTWRTALAAGLMAAGLTGVAALTATAPLAHANGPQLAQLVAAVCDMTTYVERKVKGSDLLPQSDFEDMCVARGKGIAATDIAKMLGVSRATVYRYLTEDGAA